MSPSKKKLQVAFTDDEHRALADLAKRLGLTMGAALRMGVTLLTEELDARLESAKDRKRAVGE